MKIAFICIKGMPIGGGVEKYTEELGSRLASRGHEVIVYCSRSYGTRDGAFKGMRIVTLPSVNSRSLQKLSLSAVATLHQFFERGIDIVHYHAIGPSVFCLVARAFGRKTVVQSHGHEWMRAKWGWAGKTFFRLTEIVGVRCANHMSAVSNLLKQYYESKYRVPVSYVPTGVNPPVRRAPERIREFGLEGNDYILFMARLVVEKGAHYLIDAYKSLAPGIKLVIAGDAQHEERYKELLRTKAAGHPGIIFTGFVTGALQEELFSNARVYVLPSEIEGLPISLLEAMSYGHCCVVSDIPENQEALGGCGLLFRNKDPADLAIRLGEALLGGAAIEEMKRNAGRRALEEFTWDSIAVRFERIYAELMCPTA
ncbi:MAG: glycosyltransferase family 4 protein [Gammaproteobacteria bacterium]